MDDLVGVKFIIGHIGAGKALATFLQGIGNNKDVKDMVFVTSGKSQPRHVDTDLFT
jgi:hypothetical protein